jgi:hypothetical protein
MIGALSSDGVLRLDFMIVMFRISTGFCAPLVWITKQSAVPFHQRRHQW